jgi:hypothetical protein
MFIRWQTTERQHWQWKRKRYITEKRYNAVLVKSARVKGKPHPISQHVTNLGSITDGERHETGPFPRKRLVFWHRVLRRLAGLELTDAQRERIVEAITIKAPFPKAAEMRAWDTHRVKIGFPPIEWPHVKISKRKR